MCCVVELSDLRTIRNLRAKIQKMDDCRAKLKIIWDELTAEEKTDPVTQRRVQASLLKMQLTKFRAENVIRILEAKTRSAS